MIINNPKKRNILKLWRQYIEKNNNIDIAVSYITSKGWELLFDGIDVSKKKIRVIASIDDNITNKKSIDSMLKSGAEIRLTSKDKHDIGFHAKFIVMTNGMETSFSGSVNITFDSFTNKVEQTTQSPAEQSLIYFEQFWSKAISWKEFDLSYEKTEESIIEIEQKISEIEIEDIDLNPMQIKAAEDAEKLLIKNENKMVLWAATGTGKTVFSIWLKERINARKILFIIHQKRIIESAMNDYAKFRPNLKIGKLNDDYSKLDVVFSTDKTAFKYLTKDDKFIDEFDMIILDECHHLGPDTEYEFIFDKAIEHNKFVFGMTATIRRTDFPQYVPLKFGGKEFVIGKITTEIAFKQNVIVPIEYKSNLSNLNGTLIEKFETAYKEIKTKPTSDEGKIKCIIFVSSIKEVEILSGHLSKIDGLDFVSLHSKKNEKISIDEITKRLSDENDQLQFLIAVDILNEGVDIPCINTIISCRETSSEIVFTQQIGRGLRKSEGKNHLNFYDMVGNSKNDFHKYKFLFGIEKGDLDAVQITKNLIEINSQLREKGHIKSGTNKLEMKEIPQEDIVKMISSLKLEDNLYNSWKRRISEYVISNESFSLTEAESKILKEPIQLIVNNFKRTSLFKIGKDKSWLVDFYEDYLKFNFTQKDIESITNDEHILIELLSWMPITTSNKSEKNQIIRLLSGEKVEFNQTWTSYFLGQNIITEGSVQFFEPPHKDYLNKFLEIVNTNVRLNLDSTTKITKFLLSEVKEYLLNNLRDDKFRYKAWYSRPEMCFMMDRTNIERSGEFKILKTKTNFDKINDYAINGYVSGKNKNFSNFILSNKEIVFSRRQSNKDKLYEVNENVHLFVRSKDGIVKKLFNNPKLLMYLGKGSVSNNTIVRFKGEAKDEMQYKFTTQKEMSEYERFILEN